MEDDRRAMKSMQRLELQHFVPRSSGPTAAQRSTLPATLPRPVKLTRDRTYTVPPPAHIRVRGVETEDHQRDTIARKLGMKLGKFASSIERITVRLSDANGPKGGRDQTCRIKVVLSGLPSLVVEERASVLHDAIDRAMQATALAVRRSVQRRRLKALHHRASQPPSSVAE
jgi:ribosome-associated translation inhibitor RaiA